MDQVGVEKGGEGERESLSLSESLCLRVRVYVSVSVRLSVSVAVSGVCPSVSPSSRGPGGCGEVGWG